MVCLSHLVINDQRMIGAKPYVNCTHYSMNLHDFVNEALHIVKNL